MQSTNQTGTKGNRTNREGGGGGVYIKSFSIYTTFLKYETRRRKELNAGVEVVQKGFVWYYSEGMANYFKIILNEYTKGERDQCMDLVPERMFYGIRMTALQYLGFIVYCIPLKIHVVQS